MRSLWIVTVLGLACLVGCQAATLPAPGPEAGAPMPDSPRPKPLPRPPFVGSWLPADAQCRQADAQGIQQPPIRPSAPAVAAPAPHPAGAPLGPLCKAQ
jgi:hypothetical protein